MSVDLATLLADPARVGEVPAAELAALVIRLGALQSAIGARLHGITGQHADDECACLAVEEVSRLLTCSVDLIRERGEEWGIAKVLARDSRGRPSRIVYPKVLLRAFLGTRNGIA